MLEDGYPNARVWKLYHHMEDALAAAKKASGLSGGTQTCSEYHLMTLGTVRVCRLCCCLYYYDVCVTHHHPYKIHVIPLQSIKSGQYLEKSAMVNVGFSLSIAVVVIFAVTKNYWLTAIASVCLYTIISLVFAEMVIFGWTINILEAVCMSIAGAFCLLTFLFARFLPFSFLLHLHVRLLYVHHLIPHFAPCSHRRRNERRLCASHVPFL